MYYIHLQTNTVVSILTIKTLTQFIDYMIDNNLIDVKNYNPHFYNVINPDFLSLGLLTDVKRKEIVTHLEEYAKNKGGNIEYALQAVINELKSINHNNKLIGLFRKEISYYDIKRNENIKNTFPELEELF